METEQLVFSHNQPLQAVGYRKKVLSTAKRAVRKACGKWMRRIGSNQVNVKIMAILRAVGAKRIDRYSRTAGVLT